jgi:hypothetical protein
VVGTIDVGGMPEQGVTDGKGHVYFGIEDKANIAVVDAKTMMTRHLRRAGDGESHSLRRLPQPHRHGDSQRRRGQDPRRAHDRWGTDGGQNIIKENGPTSVVLEQTVPTMTRARTLTLDSKINWVLLMAFELAPPPAAASPADAPGGGFGGRGGGGSGQQPPDSFTIMAVGK